jgi:hypothetical protein
VTDNLLIGVFLVFLDKFFGAREGDLVYVFFHFIGGHADTVIGVGNQFPQEDFVVGVERLLDNGKDILSMNSDIALF